MFDSGILDLVIGIVFVWLLLSVAVSAVNQAFAWVTRVRAKLLWRTLSEVVDAGVRAPDGRFRTVFWRTPLGRDDARPVATGQEPSTFSARRDAVTAQMTDPPTPTVQGLYEILSERVPDPAPRSWRTRISAVPKEAVSDAFVRLAEVTVTRASLLAAIGGGGDPELVRFVGTLPDGVLEQPAADQVPAAVRAAFDAAWIEAERMVTLDDIEALVAGDQALGRALRRLADIVDPAERLDRARAEIERWFDSSMEGLSSFYRRQSRKIAAVIALPIVLFTTSDVFDLFDRLQEDEDLRAAISSQASGWVAADLVAGGGSLSADVVCEQAAASRTAASGSTTTAAPSTTASSTTTPATTSPSSTTAADEGVSLQGAVDEARRRAECLGELFGSTDLVEVLSPAALWDEIEGADSGDCAICDLWSWLRSGLAGRLVTWVALLFGAEFWYDALRRLTGLRGRSSPTPNLG